MSLHKRGSKPHKFKVGQVVFWGNGVFEYVQILRINPLHCEGGCPSYAVSSRIAGYDDISEEVLRPLTAEEVGLQT